MTFLWFGVPSGHAYSWEDDPECFTAEDVARGKHVDFGITAATEEILAKKDEDEKVQAKTEEEKKDESQGGEEQGLFEPPICSLHIVRRPAWPWELRSRSRWPYPFALPSEDGTSWVRWQHRTQPTPHKKDGAAKAQTLARSCAAPGGTSRLAGLACRLTAGHVSLPGWRPVRSPERVSTIFAPSISVQSGDVIAARWRGEWHVAMVLTTYRILKKGSGAVPCTGQIAKAASTPAECSSSSSKRTTPEYFVGDIDRDCLVLPVECIGIRLDGESCKRRQQSTGSRSFWVRTLGV